MGRQAAPSGHELKDGGVTAFDAWGHYSRNWHLHAKCSCGALSPEGLSRRLVERWHREHLRDVRRSARPRSA